jgi:hypothetical protein
MEKEFYSRESQKHYEEDSTDYSSPHYNQQERQKAKRKISPLKKSNTLIKPRKGIIT